MKKKAENTTADSNLFDSVSDEILSDAELGIKLDDILGIGGGDLRIKTEEWLKANPGIYRMFEKYALQMCATRRHFGIALLFERVRWDVMLNQSSEDIFKLNNNHRAYVARKLVQDHPELRDAFQFRKTRC